MKLNTRSLADDRLDSGQGAVAAQSPGERSAKLKAGLGRLAGPLGGLIALGILMSSLTPFFFTVKNFLNIGSQIAPIGIMAVGMTLVVIIGGIDLSVAAVATLTMMVAGSLYQDAGWPFSVALLVGIAVGAFSGLVNGILVTIGKLQPFIASLATMSVATGLSLFVTNASPVFGFPEWFEWLTTGDFIGGAHFDIALMLVVLVMAAFWLRFRPTGRSLYAIGGNAEVARLAGIPVARTEVQVYVVAGILYSVAGCLVASRLDTANPVADPNTLLGVIAAVVIGGASLTGGVGTMSGTLIGVLIIGVVNNGLALLNVPSFLQQVILGGVIVAAVLAERFRKR